VKFCLFIESFCLVLSYLNLTKLKLEYLKSGFKVQKMKERNTDKKFLHHTVICIVC